MTDNRFDDIVKRKLNTLEGYSVSQAKIDRIMGLKQVKLPWYKQHFLKLTLAIGTMIVLGFLGLKVKNLSQTISELTLAQSSADAHPSYNESFTDIEKEADMPGAAKNPDGPKPEIGAYTTISHSESENKQAANIVLPEKDKSKDKSVNFGRIIAGTSNNISRPVIKRIKIPVSIVHIIPAENSELKQRMTENTSVNNIVPIQDTDTGATHYASENISVVLPNIFTIPLKQILSSEDQKVKIGNIPSDEFKLTEPLLTRQPTRFGFGPALGAGHENINAGLLIDYSLGKSFGLMAGVRFNKNRERKYDNDDSFSQSNQDEFANVYAPTHGGKKLKDIVVREYRIEIPLYFQYFRLVTNSMYLMAYAGPVLGFSEKHTGSFQIEGATDILNFQKSINHPLFSSVETGLGVGKSLGHFSFQLLPSVSLPVSAENSMHSKKHMELNFFGQFRAIYHF